MARGDFAAGLQRLQEPLGLTRRDASDVRLDCLVERDAERPAQGVQHGAVDERGTVVRDQWVESFRRTAIDLRLVVRPEMAEGGVGATGEIGLAREGER